MTNLEIYKIVRELVLVVTGVPTVIKSNPNAPSPDGEYCAISITQPVSQRGQANTKTKTIVQPGGWDGVGFDIRTQLEIDASLNFYRGNAHEYARALPQANKRPDIQELLFKNNVGWNKTSAINNLNALQSENWENRAQIVLTLMFEGSSEVDTNGIYKVGIDVFDENDNLLESVGVDTPTP